MKRELQRKLSVNVAAENIKEWNPILRHIYALDIVKSGRKTIRIAKALSSGSLTVGLGTSTSRMATLIPSRCLCSGVKALRWPHVTSLCPEHLRARLRMLTEQLRTRI